MVDPQASATREAFRALDAADPLRAVRAAFEPGRPGTLYFDANSIGAMPRDAGERIARVLEAWRTLRRDGWSRSDWLEAPRRLGDKLAPVIGARAGEVIVCDTTSVNLAKALASALALRPGRKRIVTEAATFPTDLYAMQGLARFHPGLEIVYAESPEAVAAAIDADTAVLVLSHTDYRSAFRHDLAQLTRAAHAHGALTLWDLSHSAGAVPVALDAAEADFAVGCGYKYLCGGPGAPAYLYVHRRLQDAAEPGLFGWMGHADKFAFARDYVPAAGIARHLVGTPVVTANAILEAALDVWSGVPLEAAFGKHASLGDRLIALVEQLPAAYGLTLASPREAGQRGGFVAIRHAHAQALCAALGDAGVVVSHRPPDVLRFGVSPLYHAYVDVWDAIERLGGILSAERWREPKYRVGSSI